VDFIDKELEEYCIGHTSDEPETLAQLNRETWLKLMFPRMLSGHLQGRFLSMISKMIQPTVVLEIGTFSAYGSSCLAEGLAAGGKVITIEINRELDHIIRKYIDLQGYNDRIEVHYGDALAIIPGLETQFDMVFLDGDKEQYCHYFDLVFPKLNPGGFLLADNVLWSGKVIRSENEHDPETKGILAFNEKIRTMEGIEKIMLPFRDGLYMIRKNEDRLE
jgi:predicted O-methyltransferase YrrM